LVEGICGRGERQAPWWKALSSTSAGWRRRRPLSSRRRGWKRISRYGHAPPTSYMYSSLL